MEYFTLTTISNNGHTYLFLTFSEKINFFAFDTYIAGILSNNKGYFVI